MPGVSLAKDLSVLSTGYNFILKEKVPGWEQGITAASLLVPGWAKGAAEVVGKSKALRWIVEKSNVTEFLKKRAAALESALSSFSKIQDVLNDAKVKSKQGLEAFSNIVKDIFGEELSKNSDEVIESISSMSKKALKRDAPVIFEPKILGDMKKRGWSEETVYETLHNPYRTIKTKDIRRSQDAPRLNEPATAYLREDGHYVVRNDKTGKIVQVSDTDDPDWIAPFKTD